MPPSRALSSFATHWHQYCQENNSRKNDDAAEWPGCPRKVRAAAESNTRIVIEPETSVICAAAHVRVVGA